LLPVAVVFVNALVSLQPDLGSTQATRRLKVGAQLAHGKSWYRKHEGACVTHPSLLSTPLSVTFAKPTQVHFLASSLGRTLEP
jgi:hypothetical protein